MPDHIQEEGSLRKYRTEIPNTVVRGERGKALSVHAKWLYVYIKGVCGDDGKCWQGTRTMAEGAGMSMGSVSSAKKELEKAGLLVIDPGDPAKHKSDTIRIVDLWPDNMKEFGDKKPDEDPVQEVNTPRSGDEHPRSPDEQSVQEVNVRRTLLRRSKREDEEDAGATVSEGVEFLSGDNAVYAPQVSAVLADFPEPDVMAATRLWGRRSSALVVAWMLEQIRQNHTWPRVVAAMCITSDQAQNPNIKYAQSVLDNLDTPHVTTTTTARNRHYRQDPDAAYEETRAIVRAALGSG